MVWVTLYSMNSMFPPLIWENIKEMLKFNAHHIHVAPMRLLDFQAIGLVVRSQIEEASLRSRYWSRTYISLGLHDVLTLCISEEISSGKLWNIEKKNSSSKPVTRRCSYIVGKIPVSVYISVRAICNLEKRCKLNFKNHLPYCVWNHFFKNQRTYQSIRPDVK